MKSKQDMKFLKNRNQFIQNKKINEKFDMSGEAGGPLGNDINWGDSLIGRLLNSIARKAKIGMDVKRIETLSNRIKSEFDDLLADAISKSSDDSSTIEYIKISYLLGDLRTSVVEGRKVKYLIQQTKSTIDYVEKSEVSTKEGNEYQISQESKDELLKQLNDFLKFLEQFGEEEGETNLSEEVTGLGEGEDPSKTEQESEEGSEEGEGSEQLKYSEMVSLLTKLKLIMDNKDNVKTFTQDESESKEKATNIKYVLNKIISAINEFRPDDKKFGNDLLKKSEITKWPVLEISDNKIIYRKSKKLVELTENGKLMVNIPKYDETNKRYIGDSKPILMDFNNKTITRISKYIFNQLNDIESVIKSDRNFKLNDEEVKWFNQNIKGKWLVIPSKKGNFYKTQIGDCNASGQVNFLTPPVKGQIPTNVNTILSKGVLFNDKSEADKLYDDKFQSGKNVLSKKGKVVKKETNPSLSQVERERTPEVVTSESYTLFYDVEFLLEKTILSGNRDDANANEDYLNQALSNLKKQFKSLEDNGVNSQLLKSLIDASKTTDEEGRPKNIKVIKLLMKDIKDSYNRIGDIGKLFNESIETISNISKRQQIADKIARFAKFSLQLEGENMYGGLGEIGKPLQEFNTLFKKLLNTEFVEKKSESKLLNYKSFLNEEKEESIESEVKTKETSDKIRGYFFKNMDYDRWVIEETDVEKIKRNVEESSKVANTYGFDHIIEIVKLFNKAYKIYTTPTIPSGRTGGKVSNKTYREYSFIGDGTPGKPSDPGYGPWRNNKVFDRFESAILDIIKSDEYKPIFNEKTVIVTGDGKKKEGGGKILLKFINNLLDGDKYYKSGVQKKFMEEYFGLPVDPKSIEDEPTKEGEKTTQELADDVKVKSKLTFKKTNEVKISSRSLYAIGQGGAQEFTYMMIISEDENNVYVKYSNSFSQFKKYFKDIETFKGDIPTVNKEKREIFFGAIDKDKFDIQKGDEIKIKSLSLKEFRKGNKLVKEKTLKIREINVLLDEDMKIGKLPKDYSTSYGDEDSNKYQDLKSILK